MAASAACSKKGVEMVHEWTGPVTRGNMCEAHRALYVRYIRTHHYYYLLLDDLRCYIELRNWPTQPTTPVWHTSEYNFTHPKMIKNVEKSIFEWFLPLRKRGSYSRQFSVVYAREWPVFGLTLNHWREYGTSVVVFTPAFAYNEHRLRRRQRLPKYLFDLRCVLGCQAQTADGT